MADAKQNRPDDEIDPKDLGLGSPEALSILQEIEKALGEDDTKRAVRDENSFEFPLSELLTLFPKQYVKEALVSEASGMSVVLKFPDLFAQLSKGKLAIPISQLAYFVPIHLIYHAAFDDNQSVVLPLPSVVRCVGIPVLQKHMARTMRVYDISEFTDPFPEAQATAETAAAVVFEDEDAEEPAPPVSLPKAAPVVAKAAPEPAVPAPAPVVEKPPAVAKAAERVPEKVAEPTMPAEEQPLATAFRRKKHEAVPTESAPEAKVESAPPAADDAKFVFKYPVAALLGAMPPECVAAGAVQSAGDATIDMNLPDLFLQLRQGKVTVPAGMIAGRVPRDLLTERATPDLAAPVTLSLSMVVQSVGLDALKARRPSADREYEIKRMVDPFAEPKELPKLVKQPKRPKAVEKAGSELPGEGQATSEADAPMAARPVTYVPSGDGDAELEFHELPGNVNLNAATIEELMVLDGVTEAIAAGIVKHREKHGGFKSIFELRQVPGIGHVQFRKMTGMEAETRRYHRRRRLAGLIKVPPEKITDLDLVVRTIAGKAGFSGCIIADREGLVLAEHGARKAAEDLSAVMPRMIRQIRENMELIGVGRIGSMTIGLDNVMVTVAASENVIFIVIHQENQISETELSFVRKVSKELAWLLSLRAYVGPKV